MGQQGAREAITLDTECPECSAKLIYERRKFDTGGGQIIQKHRIYCEGGNHVPWNYGAPEMPRTTSRSGSSGS